MSEAETVTNIYEALGFEDAEEMTAKGDLAGLIFRVGRERNLSDDRLASLAGCPSERMKQLHEAKLDEFSIEELSRYLVAPGHGV
ncbi:MAG: helix-turn-helix domain-containing protein, partial [Candidatus Hydrogenedentes bacterium]|nr:helix-turn-helix domain-containing protein [Candidatus Hydrogenedentota bacterium]